MMAAAEPLTSRAQTRLKFLQGQHIQLRTYKSDLQYCLLSSKQVLRELLQSRVVSNRALDYSAQTEISSRISLKTFQQTLQQNRRLHQQFRKLQDQREKVRGHALICSQLTEESARKEFEHIKELEEKESQVKYLLEKKETRVLNLRNCADQLQYKIQSLKEEIVLVLPLQSNSLKLHKAMEMIKFRLGKFSKKLQNAELQRDKLMNLTGNLAKEIDKFRLLSKNPIVRKRNTPFSQQNLDMSLMVRSLQNSDSDSLEQSVFPDKFQIRSKAKPELPKLDFTKLGRKITQNKPQANPNPQKLKSRIKQLQQQCKAKTDTLQILKEKIQQKEQKNLELVNQLQDKPLKTSRIPSKPKTHKRAMSNALDYFNKEPNLEAPLQENLIDLEEYSVIQMEPQEFEEADSVLFYCVNEINNEWQFDRQFQSLTYFPS